MQVQDNAAWLVMENMSKPYFLLNSCDIFNLFTPGWDKQGTVIQKIQPWFLRPCPRQQGPGKADTVPRDPGPLPGDTQGVAKC